VDLVGTGHVAIGTDLDANYRPVVTEHGQFASIGDGLTRRGFTAPEVDAVLGGNVIELWRAVAG